MDSDILELLNQVEVKEVEEKSNIKRRGTKKVPYDDIKLKEYEKLLYEKLPSVDSETIKNVLKAFMDVNMDLAKKSFDNKISIDLETPIGKIKIDYFENRKVWNPADLVYTETEEKVQIKFKTKRLKGSEL